MDELEQLLRRTRAGDRGAFDALGRWLNTELQGFFSSRFGAEQSRELAQRTVLDLLEDLEEAPLRSAAFTSMVHGYARIEVRRWLGRRGQEARRAIWRAEHAEVQTPRRGMDELFAEQERWEIAESILEGLPTTHREVLLARLRGHSYKTIAAAFDIKVGTARARARAAKLRVIAQWERERVTRTTFRTTEEAS